MPGAWQVPRLACQVASADFTMAPDCVWVCALCVRVTRMARGHLLVSPLIIRFLVIPCPWGRNKLGLNHPWWMCWICSQLPYCKASTYELGQLPRGGAGSPVLPAPKAWQREVYSSLAPDSSWRWKMKAPTQSLWNYKGGGTHALIAFTHVTSSSAVIQSYHFRLGPVPPTLLLYHFLIIQRLIAKIMDTHDMYVE